MMTKNLAIKWQMTFFNNESNQYEKYFCMKLKNALLNLICDMNDFKKISIIKLLFDGFLYKMIFNHEKNKVAIFLKPN